MKKLIAIFICLLLCLAGCSTPQSVNTDATKALTKELQEISQSITKVRFTFRRPNLYCRIDMSKQPSKEELESIVASMKAFSTVHNMNEIARSVNWGLEISNIYLDINTDKDPKTIEHAYYAKYYKTFDASDHSEANIEAYRIWYERDDHEA